MSIELDIGPLSWVKGEIDLALERASAALSAPAGKELTAACDHLHQAHGALAIVGLDGITEFSDALEKLFSALAAGQVAGIEQAIAAAQAGIAALRGYLDGLMGGEPNQPLKLYPAYAGLLTARGEAAPGPVALFFPDLTQRPPKRDVEIPPPEGEKLAGRLKMARMGFERGLLKWIKGDAKGAGEMKTAVGMVEATRVQPADRAFWWVSLGFYAALAADALPDAAEAKKLAMKIGGQIKKFTEGQTAVPDRLLAEALYQVAVATGGGEPVDVVRAAYRLGDLIPRSTDSAAEARRPLLARLRELIAGAKEDWNRLCAGTAAALPPFHEKITQVAERAAALGQPDLAGLGSALQRLTDALRRDPARHGDAMGIEVATALLLADNALENFERLDADFAHQVDTVAKRLDAVMAGEALGGLELPHLDAMSRRAQEKLLLTTVGQEITANLGQVEQALDAYFRDPGRAEGRAALAALAKPLKQIEGALAVLGQDRACGVLRECETEIARLAEQGGGDRAQFEQLAGRLSALGFFVEQLQLGTQPDIDAILNPQAARAAADTEAAETAAAPVAEAPAALPPANAPPERAVDTEAPPAEPAALALPPDLPDLELPDLPALPAAAETPAAAPPAAAAPAPASSASGDADVDAELLGIFLEEAHEVLAAIDENFPRVQAAPGDLATLTTLRRSFHTLKGSGRMVGLTDLGEAAWGVEQSMNHWLQGGQPASPALLAMIALAIDTFRPWVAALAEGRHDYPDPAPLAAHCARVLAGETEMADAATAAMPEVAAEPAVAVVESAPEEAPPELPSLELPSLELPPLDLPADELMAGPADLSGDMSAEAPAEPAPEPAEEAIVETISQPEPAGGLASMAPALELAAEEIGTEPLPELAAPADTPPALEPLAALPDETAIESPGEAAVESVAELLTEPVAEPAAASVIEPLAPPIEPPADGDVSSDVGLTVATVPEAGAEPPAPAAAEPEPLPVEVPPAGEPTDETPLEAAAETTAPSPEMPGETAEDEGSAADMIARIEADEQARIAAELDAAELAAMEAILAAEGGTSSMPESATDSALPPSTLMDFEDIADFDFDLPERELAPLTPLPPASPSAPEPGAVAPASTLDSAPAEPPPSAEVHPFPAPPPVEVGELQVSPVLYALYMDEARGHLAEIQSRLGAEGVPDNELIRAAHTLASISGTTGIEAIHHLARALELALGRLTIANRPASDAQRFVFARCAGALEGMLGAVANRRLPGEEAELAAALEAMQPEFPVEAPADAAGMTELALPAPPLAPPAPPPAEQPESLEERRARRMDDDIDEQLLPLFLEESVDLMRSIGETLRAWRTAPDSADLPRQLQRDLHTLKGSARMAGAMGCGELLHSMESRIEQAVAMRAVSPEMLDSLETSFDRGEFLIDRLRRGEFGSAAPAPAADDSAVRIETDAERSAEETGTAEDTATAADAAPASPGAAAAAATATTAAPGPATPAQQVHLRVRADLVDRLVNEAGEVAIARARIEGEMRSLKTSLLELTENVIRLRNQVRDIEIQAETQMQSQMAQLKAQAEEAGEQFDPLEFDRFTRFQELTRMMAESVNDVATVQQNLLGNLNAADASLAAQARLNRELSQRLMSVRMVPFETLAERLHRVVRQAAKDAGKRANLDIRGGQTGIDRSVLEKIGGPLEHLLRNAVAHGIEAPAAREAAGKAVLGQITLSLAQEGNDVVIALADDGGGLDFARIRTRGIERGLLPADGSADERTLAGLIFESGFSTAAEVTTLSGRGVGMDVVKNEIESLGGRIEISTVPGQGSTFRLYLPLTLAVSQAVIIESGGRRYALPSSMVEQASELKPEAIAAVRLEGATEWLGRRYPWHYLPRLLGDAAAQPVPARRHWLLLIKGGTERVALEIDGLYGNQEIVIKAIGPQLARVPGIAGATVLGDGEIALILNPIALAARAAARAAADAAAAAAQPAAAKPAAAPAMTDTQILREVKPAGLVMVVDDSLTVRKITGRLLGRHGYEVVTAKDGVDALEQLVEIRPAVMLVDIEMPRMDGFELSRTIRADAGLKHIPIVMITSRSADKHRLYAQEIGVNHYLGKPYDEEHLLALVAGYTGKDPAT